ncbi:MAG TPA: hypothetical protein VIU61_25290 [Kofleriaceae bacterium]
MAARSTGMRIPIPLPIAIAVALGGIARADSVSRELWIRNTPPVIVEAGERAGLWATHRLSGAPTPYLRGDLDGDRLIDNIILVTARSDGAKSLVVLWGKRTRKPSFLEVSNPPSSDAGYWWVHPTTEKPLPRMDGLRAPRLKGDVIVMTDADTQVVYWTGSKLGSYRILDPVAGDEPAPWAD